jgi:hypothetical protein
MKMIDIKLKTETGSTSLGLSQTLVDYITKTKKWDYIFDCIINNKRIDRTNWYY